MAKTNYMMTVDDVPEIQKKAHGLHKYGWRTGRVRKSIKRSVGLRVKKKPWKGSSKDINIRFNLDKEEHKKAWDYMQKMDRSVEKSYSKVIIKSLIRYFENTDAENKAEMSENYWERFRK